MFEQIMMINSLPFIPPKKEEKSCRKPVSPPPLPKIIQLFSTSEEESCPICLQPRAAVMSISGGLTQAYLSGCDRVEEGQARCQVNPRAGIDHFVFAGLVSLEWYGHEADDQDGSSMEHDLTKQETSPNLLRLLIPTSLPALKLADEAGGNLSTCPDYRFFRKNEKMITGCAKGPFGRL